MSFGKSLGILLLGSAVGAAGTWIVYPEIMGQSVGAGAILSDSGEKKPLYWVAPMDPNYRRDKPGLSPMGMDLVPVYEEDESGGPDEGPGTIKVSPEVINNLGVRTAEAQLKTLKFKINTVGYVQYNQDSIVHLSPRVSGWVEKSYIKAEGEQVEKGQPLYELYSPELVNAQEEYLLALSQGNSRMIRAAKARLTAFNISDQQIQSLKKSRKVKQNLTFKAPVKGVVSQLSLADGMFIQPNKTLLSIADLDEVWVEAEVFEQQASLVSKGLSVEMTLDFLPGRVWNGEIDYVYPTLTAKSRTLKVRMRFANPNAAIKPNMFARIQIQRSAEKEALTIPQEAIIRTGQANRVVLALGEGRFKSVNVTTGRSDGEYIEILDGLEAGEKVATSAHFMLDSESSKASDFKRMHKELQVDSVWIEASVNSVMAHHNMLNLNHAPVPEWKWPSMTMNFDVDPNLSLDELEEGMTVHIQVTKEENEYLITTIHIPDNQSKDHPKMDHSKMDYSQMNHGEMDHSKMDHSKMDHSSHEGMKHD